MELRTTTLSENTAAVPNLLAEWGLSVLIETASALLALEFGGDFMFNNAGTKLELP